MTRSDYLYKKAFEHNYYLGTGWMINWPPGIDIELGMVGKFEKGTFRRQGFLQDPSRAVAWSKDPYPGTPDGPWYFQSDKSVKYEMKLQGGTDSGWNFIGHAKAGLIFSFDKGGGIVVSTVSSHEEYIADQKALGENLIAAFRNGNRMDEQDVIVTGVRIADSGFILISHEDGGEVQATTNADIKASLLPDLAELTAGIHIKSQHGMSVAASYPNGFALAFQGLRLVGKYWRWLPVQWRFGNITADSLRADKDEGEIFLELPDQSVADHHSSSEG